MNALSRRGALLGTSAMSVAALGGCATGSSNTGTGGMTVTLPQVQAEFASIKTAVDAANVQFQASTEPAAQKQLAATISVTFDEVAATVAGLSSSSASGAVQQAVSGFLSNVQQIIPVLAPVFGLNPAAGMMLSLGIALGQAFVANLALPVTPAAPTTSAAMLGASMAPFPVPPIR